MTWVILGDFNKIMTGAKKIGCRTCGESHMQEFHDALAYYDLHELDFIDPMFTWWDCVTKLRLICSVILGFPISLPVRVIMFHCYWILLSPLFLCIEKHRFSFESFWASHDSCEDVVRYS